MVASPFHRSSVALALAIPLAASAAVLVVIAACATGSAPASRTTSAGDRVPVDTASDGGQSPAPALWLVRDAILDARLSELRIASWPEHRDAVETFYTRRDFTAAWVRKNRPTQAALEVIDLIEHADAVGLIAEDYDAGRWADRVSQLQSDKRAEVDRARFDLALTVSANATPRTFIAGAWTRALWDSSRARTPARRSLTRRRSIRPRLSRSCRRLRRSRRSSIPWHRRIPSIDG